VQEVPDTVVDGHPDDVATVEGAPVDVAVHRRHVDVVAVGIENVVVVDRWEIGEAHRGQLELRPTQVDTPQLPRPVESEEAQMDRTVAVRLGSRGAVQQPPPVYQARSSALSPFERYEDDRGVAGHPRTRPIPP